jgi:Holliday junction resolvase RusA-like endonuclease
MPEPSRESSRDRVKVIPTRIVEYQELRIDPVPKPRMTRADRWKTRPPVQRYWDYKDKLLELTKGIEICYTPLSLQFILPMPKSWSKKKKAEMNLQKHESTPDLDNLIKAFKDALLKEDSMVWCYDYMTKVWGYEGMIILMSPHKAHKS